MKQLLISFVLLGLLVSCDKGEIPIKKRGSGEVSTQSLDMNADYRYQLFYDCETNSMVQKSLKTNWDIGFQCGGNEWQVTLNTAKYMSVWRTSETDMTVAVDTVGADWAYDNVRGKLDSTAFGDWQSVTPIYVVDRGYNPTGIHQGFKKIQITNVSSTAYNVTVADMDGSNLSDHVIEKNTIFNRVCYSLDTKEIVPFEPPKEDWDLLFSQYTHIYSNGHTYLVTGVLLNPYQTTATEEWNTDYNEIDYNDALDMDFTADSDLIGYDWKFYDFGAGGFVILDVNYVINTSSSRLFKIRFTDFYDEFGTKGVPTFEIQEL